MAIPKPAIFVGVGSATVIVGGITGFSYLNSSQNIREKLVEDGYQILKDDSNEWTSILTHYKGIEGGNKTTLHFEGFDGTSPTEGAETILKTKCKEALDSKSTDDSNYKKAKHWCTVPRTLASEISKKHRLLSTDTSQEKDNEDKDLWDQKMAKHESHTPAEEKISDLGLVSNQVTTKAKTERDKLRNKCKSFEGKKHYENDFEATLKKSTLWCAVPKQS